MNDDEFNSIYDAAIENINVGIVVPNSSEDYKASEYYFNKIIENMYGDFNMFESDPIFKEYKEFGTRCKKMLEEYIKKNKIPLNGVEDYVVRFQHFFIFCKLEFVPITNKTRDYFSYHITPEFIKFINGSGISNARISLDITVNEMINNIPTDELHKLCDAMIGGSLAKSYPLILSQSVFKYLYYYASKLIGINSEISFTDPIWNANELYVTELEFMKNYIPFYQLGSPRYIDYSHISYSFTVTKFKLYKDKIKTIESKYAEVAPFISRLIKNKYSTKSADSLHSLCAKNMVPQSPLSDFDASTLGFYLHCDILLSTSSMTSTTIPETRTFAVGGHKYKLDEKDIETVYKYEDYAETVMRKHYVTPGYLDRMLLIITDRFMFSSSEVIFKGADYTFQFRQDDRFYSSKIDIPEKMKMFLKTEWYNKDKNIIQYIVEGGKTPESNFGFLILFDTLLAHACRGLFFFEYCDFFEIWKVK